MRPGSRYVWKIQLIQLFPVTCPCLFEQNFLKAAGRTQIRRQAAICMYRQDCLEKELKTAPVSVGCGQHWSTLTDDPSSSMFERTCEKCLSNYVLDFDLKMIKHCKKMAMSISEYSKKTAHHTKWPCLLQPFSSFLHCWPYWHQVSWTNT